MPGSTALKNGSVGLLSEDFFHWLAPGQLIHQLIEPADLLLQRMADLFDPDAADQTGDELGLGIDPGGIGKKGRIIGVLF